jgi:transcriptional regulator GlxA family with amidase domain
MTGKLKPDIAASGPHSPLVHQPAPSVENMVRTVGIFLFEDVEALDFAGPYEVFTTASRVAHRLSPSTSAPFAVITVAQSTAPVRARAGMAVIPDYDIHTHPPIDVLIIPGGVVTRELAKPQVIDWIAAQSGNARLTASVCTGAFLLAAAGLLESCSVTTHWEDIADLRAMFPRLTVREGQRWVDAGNIVTSAGISAGIDMSLHLVERLANRRLALDTARQMEFDWTENQAGTAR